MACDILIIGAGPAGSSAAISATRKGMDVLVTEQRAEIGVPVQCAEYIPAPLVGQINLGTGYIVQEVSKMRTLLDGSASDMVAPGYMIHRDRFDRTLAAEARNQGAKFLLSSKAVAINKEGRITLKKRDGQMMHIIPRIIIGADGPHSKTARWCGVSHRDLLPAAQYTMALSSPMDRTEVYLSPDIYGGYGWLFQKGTRPM